MTMLRLLGKLARKLLDRMDKSMQAPAAIEAAIADVEGFDHLYITDRKAVDQALSAVRQAFVRYPNRLNEAKYVGLLKKLSNTISTDWLGSPAGDDQAILHRAQDITRSLDADLA